MAIKKIQMIPPGYTDVVHPETTASVVIEETDKRFMTDAERTKLSGVATSANNYVHPTTAGNKHIPTGGTVGQILKNTASGTATWQADSDTITTINGKTGAIAKADIVALGIPAQDTVVDISGKADTTYVDNKVKTDVPVGAKFTDTVYTHPANHPANIITESDTKRFVTDVEKNNWSGKANPPTAVTATLSTTWTGSGPYTQSVTVSGVTSTNNITVSLASTANEAQRKEARDALLSATAQATNSITITADGDKPTVIIPIQVLILGG